MTHITPAAVLAAAPGHRDPARAAEALSRAAERYGITGREATAMLLAQLGHESNITPISENLNYSAPGMARTWPSRYAVNPHADVKTPNALAVRLAAAGPEAIANNAYGGRMGNTQPGDGWRYRGRGYVQITGRDMYRSVGQALGLDLEGNPDLLLTHEVSALAALEFLKRKGLLPRLGSGDVPGVTRVINGGHNGLADRQARYARVLAVLPVEPPMPPGERVFITDGGGRRGLWNGKPVTYAGITLSQPWVVALRIVCPRGQTCVIGSLTVEVADDGAMILSRTPTVTPQSIPAEPEAAQPL